MGHYLPFSIRDQPILAAKTKREMTPPPQIDKVLLMARFDRRIPRPTTQTQQLTPLHRGQISKNGLATPCLPPPIPSLFSRVIAIYDPYQHLPLQKFELMTTILVVYVSLNLFSCLSLDLYFTMLAW